MPSPRPEALRQALLFTLKNWRRQTDEPPLAALRVTDEARRQFGDTQRQAVRRVVQDALAELASIAPTQAELLRLRYEDGEKMANLVIKYHRSTASIYRDHDAAITALARMMQAQEDEAQQRWQSRQFDRIEAATYTRLFGVDAFLADLKRTVAQEDAPRLLLLEGLGGIGKTALADALVRDAIERSDFSEFGWVTARRQQLGLQGRITPPSGPALTVAGLLEQLALQLLGDISLPSPFTVDAILPAVQQRLHDYPHLIVIDNLETLADVATLIPTLRSLLNPTKFLLTSRRSLPAQPDVYHIAAPLLAKPHALQLVRYEANLRNLPAVAAADDAELTPIYDTVGGNPLALRLVVGQLRMHSLSRVIESLKTAQGKGVDALYTFIYRQAWDDLDDTSRLAFLAMPFAPPAGSTFEHLAAISGLSSAPLQDALEALVGFNLVDRLSDNLDDVRYAIHGLTRTFLLEQVAKWQ